MPRLGDHYQVQVEITSKPKSAYLTDEYFALDLPVAPAVMVGDEIVVEGSDISDYDVEVCICRHLGLEAPDKKKSGFLGRFL